jgi:hypothetical protein
MKQRQLGDHGGSRETSQPEVTPWKLTICISVDQLETSIPSFIG